MVKVLLGLKWRYLLAGFKGNLWAIIGTIFGLLYGLGFLGLFAAGSFLLGTSQPSVQEITFWLVGFFTLLSLIWWLLPLFISGADVTLDPDYLAPYPLTTDQIQKGQLLGGFIGIAGLFTLLATLASSLALLAQPLLLVGYLLVCVPALALLVSVSRLISLLSFELNSIPGVRQVLLILATLLIIGAGPLISVFASTFENLGTLASDLFAWLSWTPLASGSAALASFYAGQVLLGCAQLLLTLLYLLVAWFIWGRLLTRAMDRVGSLKHTAGAKAVARGNIGIFKHFPATARGAVAARTVHTLFKDPRVNLNLVMVAGFYLLFSFMGRIQVDIDEETMGFSASIFMMLFIPVIAGYVYSYLVSYDNSAFSMHVLSSLSGKDDRYGRAHGLLILMLPTCTLGTILMAWTNDRMTQLPLMLGISLGLLLTTVGVSAFFDMLVSVPAPPPGANPFKTPRRSDGFAKGLVRAGIMLLNFALAIPGLVLWVIYAISGNEIYNWLAGAVGLALGVLILLLGLNFGAKRYELHAADALQRVSAF